MIETVGFGVSNNIVYSYTKDSSKWQMQKKQLS
jgi:beta-glucanase (GH16 family)